MKEIKVRFVLKDNDGNIHISKPYIWSLEDGLPVQDTILDEAEPDCTANCCTESQNHCDCPFIFDEGKVIDVIRFTGLTDKNGKEIYE